MITGVRDGERFLYWRLTLPGMPEYRSRELADIARILCAELGL